MERQLPKNVRQIGNVCDEPKIYVEDYVDTFLGQLQEKAMEKPVAAALTGEITKCEERYEEIIWMYIIRSDPGRRCRS